MHASSADVRASEIENQMTDDERFSLIVSVVGENPVIPLARDKRIPVGTTMNSGYTPSVPHLGVPALLMSDASHGVINHNFREGDTAIGLPVASCSLQ
jgi:beta-glucosidase